MVGFAAAVARAAGAPLVIEEVTVDPPKSGEVRIKVICTSLCHSDFTFWKLNVWNSYNLCTLNLIVFLILLTIVFFISLSAFLIKVPPACFPRILGHEAVG